MQKCGCAYLKQKNLQILNFCKVDVDQLNNQLKYHANMSVKNKDFIFLCSII